MGIVPRNKKMVVCDFESAEFTVLFYDGFYNITGKSDNSRLHSHNFFEIFFLVSGQSSLATANEVITLYENDVCIMPPSCLHDSVSENENFALAGFLFSVKEKKGSSAFVLNAFSSLTTPLVLKKKRKMHQYLKKIINAYYSDSLFSKEELEAYTTLMCSEIALCVVSPDAVKPSSGNGISEIPENDLRALIISEYMAQNFNKDISLKSLASHLHLCEKYTGKLIQRLFGTSFSGYLSTLRLSTAKKLILSTDMSLNKIAERVGFKSYNGFYGFFKKHMKITPEEYRVKKKDV